MWMILIPTTAPPSTIKWCARSNPIMLCYDICNVFEHSTVLIQWLLTCFTVASRRVDEAQRFSSAFEGP